MRRVSLGAPFSNNLEDKIDWCIDAIRQIEIASGDEDPFEILDGFTTTNVTSTRSLDADTVTLAELADVVGTLVEDIQARGPKRN